MALCGFRPRLQRRAHSLCADRRSEQARQIRSAARRPAVQTATLKGLGLNKLNRTRELEDTPSVRGMVNSISHLVVIIEERG